MDTFERVQTILAQHLGVDPGEATPEALVVDDLGADSLDEVEIAMALEQDFGVEISDEAVAATKTVGDLASLVDRLLAAKSPA